ncbi:MAG TPA: DUF4255 domain-containing protein [Trinickia sp.]|uniref:DUF4255 domain-containing protein n=1 Tax=Trinickia sp. TaxID=2571163 RepID=UPI002CD32C2E|nr:DUF4255 domain-containing protein [Trinickia sp.]HVW51131.1 DUF4255 domain-containing protein [Trinickia sp.]
MPTPSIDPEQVIAGVSNALRSFICAYVPRLASEDTVVFDSPGAPEAVSENKLLLYLYQIEINPELRNAPPTVSAEQGDSSMASLVLTPAPLAVDLLYMAVIFGQSPEYEQMIGGSVVGLLDRCGCIPPEFITQTLRDSDNAKLAVIPQPATIHMLRDLWAGFPNKAYHLTKLYTVSPVRLPSPGMPVDLVLKSDVGAVISNRQSQPPR